MLADILEEESEWGFVATAPGPCLIDAEPHESENEWILRGGIAGNDGAGRMRAPAPEGTGALGCCYEERRPVRRMRTTMVRLTVLVTCGAGSQ